MEIERRWGGEGEEPVEQRVVGPIDLKSGIRGLAPNEIRISRDHTTQFQELLGTPNRQRLEQHAMDERKHRRVGADPKRQRKHRYGREPSMFSKHPEYITPRMGKW